jgi:hypothetical protein
MDGSSMMQLQGCNRGLSSIEASLQPKRGVCQPVTGRAQSRAASPDGLYRNGSQLFNGLVRGSEPKQHDAGVRA